MLVRFLGLGSADRATGELQTRASPIGGHGSIAVGHGGGTGYDHRFGRIATARCAYVAVGVLAAAGNRRTIDRTLKELNG